jgi:hypothetical protein
MSGVKGQRGRPRKDGPRSPSGRLLYEWKDRCHCGQPKTKYRRQCLTCRRSARRARPRCACGGAKSYGAARCMTCETTARRDQIIERVCQQCGCTFKRKSHGGPGHDVKRFCSKKCWGAFLAAEARVTREAIRQAHSIQRELERAQRRYARSVCACGATATRDGRCSTCNSRRYQPLVARVDHVCPNCGQAFQAPESWVHCSRRCGQQLSGKGRRYPKIGALPVEDRNRIAELIALTRTARRRIDESAKSL